MPIPKAVLQRPENRVLLLCARGPQKSPQFALALGEVRDWDVLKRKLLAHRLTLLFLHHLKDHETLVPAAFLAEFRALGKQFLHWNLAFLAELQAITHVLNEGGVRFLCYKGPVLAYEAYQTLALRPFVDLDLLVSPQDIKQALACLQSLDYQELQGFSQRHGHRRCYETLVVSADGLMLLDVHWAISAPYHGFPRSFEQLWSKRGQCLPLGDVPTLCREDLIVVLCFHGAKHSWRELEWIGSLLGVLKSDEAASLDWQYIHKTFRQCGCERILYLGLHLASHLDSVDEEHKEGASLFPLHIAQLMARDASIERMARRAWELKLRGAEHPLPPLVFKLKNFALLLYFGLWGRRRAGRRREFVRGKILSTLSPPERSFWPSQMTRPWRRLRGFLRRGMA